MKLGTLIRIQNISDAEDKFAELKKYGFESCQLVYKPETYIAEDAEIIKKAAQKYGIEISAQFCGYYDNETVWDNYKGFLTSGLGVEPYRESRIKYVKEAILFANIIGITDIVVHGGFIPNNPFSAEYESVLSAVTEICDYAEKLNMNVLLETGGESAVALLRIIKDSGKSNLFVNLDPANMIMYGYANPVDSLYTIGKYVRNIHGKDGMPPSDPRILGEEKNIGEGMVDFRAMLAKLKELGYDRYITIERELDDDAQLKEILRAKDYFENLLAEL